MFIKGKNGVSQWRMMERGWRHSPEVWGGLFMMFKPKPKRMRRSNRVMSMWSTSERKNSA